MGKRKKRKATHPKMVDPMEEQNRVREAVLKVFRARVSSPGGGPAIILPAQQEEKSMSDLQLIPDRQSSEDELIIVDTLSTDGQQGTAQKTTLQKDKRRKSRGERNKEKEERKKKHTLVDHQARSEFRKHVKRADEIVAKSKLGRQSSLQCYSTITQSRLTRRLGLYNQGKKSDRILREPLPVNERILKQTEKDLRKILDTSNDIDDIEPEPHWSTPRSAPCAYDAESINYSCHSSRSQPRSDCRPSSSNTINERVEEDMGEDKKTPTLPQTPDLNILAEQLCSATDLSMFPGRDLFSEIQSELVRTLRINSRMTPSKSTPAIRLQARNSQSARRSLQPLISRSAEQRAHCNNSHPSHSVSRTNDTVMMDNNDRLQAFSSSTRLILNSLDHNQKKDTSQIPCTKSRPDDEPPLILFMDQPVECDSGKSNEHGIHNEITTTGSFPNVTILDFAEYNHSQEKDLAADFSLSAMDMIRKSEKAIASQEPMTTQMSYSSLDFLDEMDRGPLHSTVPYSHFDPQHQNHSDVTSSIFSEDNYTYPNQNPSPRTLPRLTTHTEDLFYEPCLMPEMVSPVDGNIHYYPETKEKPHCHKRRCRHASDSDESPVLCYKCLDPIKISSVGKAYSPKFHPQRMY